MADLGTRTLSKWTEQVEEERIPNLSSSKYLVSEKMNIPIITSIVFSKWRRVKIRKTYLLSDGQPLRTAFNQERSDSFVAFRGVGIRENLKIWV